MEDLLESLQVDESVKQTLIESIDEYAMVEAIKLAEEKQEEYTLYVESTLKEIKEGLEEQVGEYLNLVVEQFLEENKIAIEESVSASKMEAIQEGVAMLTVLSGADEAVAEKQLQESTLINEKVEELKEAQDDVEKQLNSVLAENKKLKDTNAELIQTGVLAELSEGMTAIEKEKFYKLASFVSFDINEGADYLKKLNAIKDSVGSTSSKTSKQTKLDEDVKKPTSSKYEVKASHLI